MIYGLLQILYWMVLTGTAAFAFWRGGRPERHGAAIMVTASVLSALLVSAETTLWESPDWAILSVDVVSILALLPLALRSDRYWPLWTTSFQITGAAMHVGMMIEPESLPRVYAILQGFWAYPALAALAIGTWHVARERKLVSAPSFSR